MTRLVLVLIVVISCSVGVAAESQVTLLHRIDAERGKHDTYTIGALTQALELWVYGASTPNPTVEIGRLWPVNRDHVAVRVGCYYSTTLGTPDRFIEPVIDVRGRHGKLEGDTYIEYYHPLRRGRGFVDSHHSWIGYHLGSSILGIAGSFRLDAEGVNGAFGPMMRVKLGSSDVLMRYLALGNRGESMRVQVVTSF